MRLDRVYTKASGRCAYPNATVCSIPFRHSDHCPVLLMLEGPSYESSNRPFWYEVAWESHEGFKDLVGKTWKPQSNMFLAAKNFKKEVSVWNRRVFGNITQKKRKLLARIAGVNNKLELDWSNSLNMLESHLKGGALNCSKIRGNFLA